MDLLHSNVLSLNDCSGDCRAEHYQIGLKDTVQGFVTRQKVSSVLFFLSEFQTSFSNREIGNENEEKRGEEGNVETNDLQ